ncbi:MAG: DUF2141 domain-containing protein [Alphaproteobacteria bacterium]|nr:DUF2141 domain-containing protein [Alphaproteobacteria bacterium]
MRMALSLLLLPIAALASAAGHPHEGTDVTVTVTQLRSADGLVRACMTGDPVRFPQCRSGTQSHRAVVEAHKGQVTVTFPDVAPGRYAIALLHDENSNGKADRALGMMPKEGFGFSRDARVRMGPPRFEDAVFEVADTPKAMAIKMRYML